MIAVIVLVILAAAIYAVINTFGAWAVVRRKPWVAGLFMLAAALLVISATSVAVSAPRAEWLLAAGLIMASLASLINAQVVIGKISPRNHLIRAAVGIAIFLIAFIALR